MHQAANTARLVQKAGKSFLNSLDKDRARSAELKENTERPSSAAILHTNELEQSRPENPLLKVTDVEQMIYTYTANAKQIALLIGVGTISFLLGRWTSFVLELWIKGISKQTDESMQQENKLTNHNAIGKLGGGSFSFLLAALCTILAGDLYLKQQAANKQRTKWFVEREIEKQRVIILEIYWKLEKQSKS
jgi:hypothetical protein